MIFDLKSLVDFLYNMAPLIGMLLLVGVYIDDQRHSGSVEDIVYRARVQAIINHLQREMKK